MVRDRGTPVTHKLREGEKQSDQSFQINKILSTKVSMTITVSRVVFQILCYCQMISVNPQPICLSMQIVFFFSRQLQRHYGAFSIFILPFLISLLFLCLVLRHPLTLSAYSHSFQREKEKNASGGFDLCSMKQSSELVWVNNSYFFSSLGY